MKAPTKNNILKRLLLSGWVGEGGVGEGGSPVDVLVVISPSE